MTKEDIEKAAIQHANMIGWDHDPEEIRRLFAYSFKSGTKWRINSVWHSASEIPDIGEAIIVELFGKVWDYGTYNVGYSIHPKAKWAYMNDLIPSKE